MSHNIEETVEELKAENLQLKLDSIRKEVTVFKQDMHRHLDLILEQTSKTNGSVARAMEKISELERQDTKARVDELTLRLDEVKKETGPFTVIFKYKWVRILIGVSLGLVGLQGILGLSIADIIKML